MDNFESNKRIPPSNRIRRLGFLLFLKGKTFLINPSFQYKFMAFVIINVIFSLIIIYGANIYFFKEFISRGEMLHLPKGHPYYLLINKQEQSMEQIFWGVGFILTIFTGFWGLFFSHRIAGPLHRINLYFKNAKEDPSKKMPKIKIRQNDFFQELPDSMNEYFEALENFENKKAS